MPLNSWRSKPYRLLFPLGWLLAWAGVLHWLLHSVGLLADYRPVFHAITQIQGFMLCFALGFLLTAIPRRTGTAPPAGWELAVALIAPIGTTAAAWFGRFALSQVFWIAVVLMLLRFAVRRLLDEQARRRPPNSFLWIPISFALGLTGSLLIASYGVLGAEYYQLHELGRLFLLQGLFVGLVLGVSGMLLPLVTRGESSRDAAATPRDQLERVAHLAAALLFAGSFLIENQLSLRGGLALRAALTLAVLLVSAGIWRPPSVPGWHRWLVWLGAWMIPLGYAVATVFPAQKKAGLHVVFIGGFALMALSVGLHVTLAHGGYERLVRGRLWRVAAFGGLMLLAVVLRGLVDFDPSRFFLWIGCSAAVFLLATLLWATVVLPRIWHRASPPREPPS